MHWTSALRPHLREQQRPLPSAQRRERIIATMRRQWVTIRGIAETYGVSDKTARRDVEAIGRREKVEAREEEYGRKGYRIK